MSNITTGGGGKGIPQPDKNPNWTEMAKNLLGLIMFVWGTVIIYREFGLETTMGFYFMIYGLSTIYSIKH